LGNSLPSTGSGPGFCCLGYRGFTTGGTESTEDLVADGVRRGFVSGVAFAYRSVFDLNNTMKRSVWVVSFLLAALCFAAGQDRPEEGGHELEFWTGGGHSVAGGTRDTGIWNAGVRYGWVLTAPHGPGFLSGRFEYAVDAVPGFVVTQAGNTAYGAGLNPVALKWVFATRGNVEPYLELNGGTLFTNHEVPAGTSAINFTSSAALGVHFVRDHTWTMEVRYMHISNAGLTKANAGINTVQVRLGFGKFFGKK
jgi:Lipid A 3-O-deacylase (PagL)